MPLKHPYESLEVPCTLIWMIIYSNYFLSQNHLPQLLKITKAFVVENRGKKLLFAFIIGSFIFIFWMSEPGYFLNDILKNRLLWHYCVEVCALIHPAWRSMGKSVDQGVYGVHSPKKCLGVLLILVHKWP